MTKNQILNTEMPAKAFLVVISNQKEKRLGLNIVRTIKTFGFQSPAAIKRGKKLLGQ